MKKIILLILSLGWISYSAAQLTMDHSFNYSATVVKINSDTYKYFLMDVPGEQCRIYNMDFSLYKTISTPVPDGSWLYDIRFVSENLFNNDSQIELLYTHNSWVVTNQNNGDGYYVYHSKVISEDGSVILDAPGVLYSYVKETAPDEYKLFLYAYDNSATPYTIQTRIYSLTGVLHSTEYLKKSSFSLDDPYPNPAEKTIHINYKLPQDMSTSNLIIIDQKGVIHSQYRVDGFTDHLRIDIGKFSQGIYYYYLANGQTRSEIKKFVVE